MVISLVAQMVKNLSAMKDILGSILGLGRTPGEENGAHCSILAWRVPWTEDLVGYSPWGHKE